MVAAVHATPERVWKRTAQGRKRQEKGIVRPDGLRRRSRGRREQGEEEGEAAAGEAAAPRP